MWCCLRMYPKEGVLETSIIIHILRTLSFLKVFFPPLSAILSSVYGPSLINIIVIAHGWKILITIRPDVIILGNKIMARKLFCEQQCLWKCERDLRDRERALSFPPLNGRLPFCLFFLNISPPPLTPDSNKLCIFVFLFRSNISWFFSHRQRHPPHLTSYSAFCLLQVQALITTNVTVRTQAVLNSVLAGVWK